MLYNKFVNIIAFLTEQNVQEISQRAVGQSHQCLVYSIYGDIVNGLDYSLDYNLAMLQSVILKIRTDGSLLERVKRLQKYE